MMYLDIISVSLLLIHITELTNENDGKNPNLNPMMVTTADTQNSGETSINAGIGFNLYVPNGQFKNLKLGFEFAMPLYQKPNGIQLQQKEQITFGLQYAL